MLESIEFQNFKALRDAKLPLGPCTILVGPNGSGKTSALQALEIISGQRRLDLGWAITASAAKGDEATVKLRVCATLSGSEIRWWKQCERGKGVSEGFEKGEEAHFRRPFKTLRAGIRVYSLDADAVAAPAVLEKNMVLAADGAGLAGVLDRLRDHHEDRFEALNDELARWLPEFERITFDLVDSSKRVFSLRTRDGQHEIPAAEVSQGTLLALAILTLAYLPDPPSLIGFEEPDRGIHPRLLRHVQDAIYRLAYPESHGEDRKPVQVLATTHSPYFLDLFRDHPEEIVIANKSDDGVQFERLSDRPDIDEILGSSPLGEVWYSGILGGVPGQP